MTVRSPKQFDPQVLLSAPSRSAGVPNVDGKKVIYTSTSYSFYDHQKRSQMFYLDVEKEESLLIEDSKGCSNPVWLDHHNIALLKSKDDESTEVLIGPLEDFKSNHYLAGTIDGSADNLKVTKLADDCYGIAVSAPANPDGTIYNSTKAKKPHSTGRLYRSLFVRHWDKWVTPQRNAIWYGVLSKSNKDNERQDQSKKARYKLSPLVNALQGTALESPIPPFGGKDHFDISKMGIIFVAKDPELDPAINTKCNAYIVPLADFSEAKPVVYEILMPTEIQGALTSPVFSPDGSKAALLGMAENGYETDKNEILIMPNTADPTKVDRVVSGKAWDYSPSTIVWSPDSAVLYLAADAQGQVTVFSLALDPRNSHGPVPLDAFDGSVSDIQPLTHGSSTSERRLFVSGSNFVDNSLYAILTHEYPNASEADYSKCALKQPTLVSSWSSSGANLGLDGSQITSLWSPCSAHQGGVDGVPSSVHSWVILPSKFDKSKKYPLAFLIHGGPQSAWQNSWSTRWNPAVFAEQGYVVCMPNPVGSTGYGQKFQDAIKEQWGNWPYEDLVNCIKYIEEKLDYVDMDRAVALGASFGGYMVNWIQGHELGRKFKALVSHDGIFSSLYSLATEEVYFVNHDLGGPWSWNKNKWAKWSPAQFTEHWKTPHLIIHSEKDYRLSMADGLAAFNVLQSQGIESELLTFPDENHWVLNPENSLVWHETVLSFINRHAGLPQWRDEEQKQAIQDPPRPPQVGQSTIKAAAKRD